VIATSTAVPGLILDENTVANVRRRIVPVAHACPVATIACTIATAIATRTISTIATGTCYVFPEDAVTYDG
jgi:hypothetical protein